MKQRILNYQTPPCHKRLVTAHACSGRGWGGRWWSGLHLRFGGHLCSIPKVWYWIPYLV